MATTMNSKHLTNWTDEDGIPTDEEISAWVRKEHARLYPNGCRETLDLCCEECALRIGEVDTNTDNADH